MVDIHTKDPLELTHLPLTSTASTLLRRERREFFPSDCAYVGPLNYGGLPSIFTIRLESDHFVDWSKCYLRLPISTWFTRAFSGGSTQTFRRVVLEAGGVHALFTKIELLDATGKPVQMISNYNKLIAHLVLAGVLGARYDLDFQMENNVLSFYSPSDIIGTTAVDFILPKQIKNPFFHLWNVFDGQIQTAENNVIVQDLIFMPYLSFFRTKEFFPLFLLPGGLSLRCSLDDTAFSCMLLGSMGDSPAAVTPHSQTMTGTADYLNYPLYKLHNPRFIMEEVVMDQSVYTYFQDKFEGEGIHYGVTNWVSQTYRTTQTPAVMGRQTIPFKFECRSARKAFVAIQCGSFQGDLAEITMTNRSLSHGLRQQIYQYVFQTSFHQYPREWQQVTPPRAEAQSIGLINVAADAGIATTQMYPHELYRALLNVFEVKSLGCDPFELYSMLLNYGSAGGTNIAQNPGWIRNSNIRRYNDTAGTTSGNPGTTAFAPGCTEPCWSVFPVKFATDPSIKCGIDLQGDTLLFHVNRAAPAILPFVSFTKFGNFHSSATNFQCWVEYDMIITVHKDGITLTQ